MESVTNDPFGKALAAARSRYNTQFALARMGQPRLQAEVFLDHLNTTVRPVIEAVHRHDPAQVGAILDVLYTMSLDLVGRGWMGAEARYPVLDKGWRRLFAVHAALLVEAPQSIATALTNALFNLSQEPSARPEVWINEMVAVGRHVADHTAWLDAGMVLAWRCGLAHYREGALAVCAHLKPDAASRALGLDETLSASALASLLSALKTDPWAQPADTVTDADARKRLRFVGVGGGFRGTGGPFITPPQVAIREGGFVVWDHDFLWSMHADAYGTVFRRLGAAPTTAPQAQGDPLRIASDGTVRGTEQGEIFPGLANASSAASTATTLAVTLPDAHYVYLVGLTRGNGE